MAKKIAILGSTGSIGRQALDVVRNNPEKLQVVGLAAGANWELLAQQTQEFSPVLVSVNNDEAGKTLQKILSNACPVETGLSGLTSVAAETGADLILVAVAGTEALIPTIKAIEKQIDIALANKETLVAAGEIVIRMAKEFDVRLLPVDSEHSAIWQCLPADTKEVNNIILTASGGPFRDWPAADLLKVTPKEALAHPTWSMGKKITIDSASMMNKGLEVIEARWLFDVDYNQVEVLVHPQSAVHGMVCLNDGTIIASIGAADMRSPIQYAFSYPERWDKVNSQIDLAELGRLEFTEVDREKFLSLELAYEAGRAGGTMPCVLNAANEVAVYEFLQGRISFVAIPQLVAKVMDTHKIEYQPDLDTILEAERWARSEARCLTERVN